MARTKKAVVVPIKPAAEVLPATWEQEMYAHVLEGNFLSTGSVSKGGRYLPAIYWDAPGGTVNGGRVVKVRVRIEEIS